MEYSGWKAYGATWQVLASGVYRTWPNPFATDAVIEPSCRVVRSVRSIRKPSVVSCMWIRIRSPGFISRSLAWSGVTALRFGVVERPGEQRVRRRLGAAAPRDVRPVDRLETAEEVVVARGRVRHAGVLVALKLSIVMAAQYCVAVQPKPSN